MKRHNRTQNKAVVQCEIMEHLNDSEVWLEWSNWMNAHNGVESDFISRMEQAGLLRLGGDS